MEQTPFGHVLMKKECVQKRPWEQEVHHRDLGVTYIVPLADSHMVGTILGLPVFLKPCCVNYSSGTGNGMTSCASVSL